MGAFKNEKNGTWYVQFRYTDWQGLRQQKLKRGFATKREAQEWERAFLTEKKADVTMPFKTFTELYEKDVRPKLKENTWLTKEHIIKTKILPYFEHKRLCDISAKDVIAWQNEIRKMTNSSGESFSQGYLKTIHNQLSSLFNHAIKIYGLRLNPASTVGNMGKEERKEMSYWTVEEYSKFSDEMMDKPLSYYAFQMLYWTGIRVGELLALTAGDFDFKNNMLTINKSYQRLHGEDVITPPKTEKSNRTIKMPQFLCDEMQEYLKGKSALMMFDKHANLKYKFGNRHFWAEGYYVSTVGLNEATIRKYIEDQEKHDIALDKLSVREYEDPFKGGE